MGQVLHSLPFQKHFSFLKFFFNAVNADVRLLQFSDSGTALDFDH